MEVNEINNMILIRDIIDKAVDFLVSQKLIDFNENYDINYEFGYIYTRNDGFVEALFKVILGSRITFYLALQENKLKLLEMDQKTYDNTVIMMKKVHSCLNDDTNNLDISMARKQRNNEILKSKGIVVDESLLCEYQDNFVSIKDINSICKRVIASLLSIQVSCDIKKGIYEQSKEYFIPFFEKFNVLKSLNKIEQRIMDGTYTEQDVIDMDSEYESFWSICWCLGLVDDITDSMVICDCDKAISFVMSSQSFEDFVNKCNIRNISEILDMEDLYYRYQWAINDENNARLLNALVIQARLRGLKWVISNIDDWYDIDIKKS